MLIRSLLLSFVFLFSNADAGVILIPPQDNFLKAHHFPSVGKISIVRKGYVGSGTLLWTGKHVLTARHVVTKDALISNNFENPINIAFVLDDGQVSNANKIFGHPELDIAILELEREFVGGYQVHAKNDLVGSAFVGVGYGRSSLISTYKKIDCEIPYGTKRVYFNIVDIKSKGDFIFDVDPPQSLNMTEGAISGEGIHLFGDSGGGLFLVHEGNIEVFAVISRLTSNYPYLGYASSAVDARNWINDVTNEANKASDYIDKKLTFGQKVGIIAGICMLLVACKVFKDAMTGMKVRFKK